MVIDASVMLEVLVGEQDPSSRLGDNLLAAPHLIDAEVGSALRRKVLAGALEPAQAEALLNDLTEADVLRYPHEPLVVRAWELRDNLSFYDALYVALAEMLDAPLVTVDSKLAGAPGIQAVVQFLPPDD